MRHRQHRHFRSTTTALLSAGTPKKATHPAANRCPPPAADTQPPCRAPPSPPPRPGRWRPAPLAAASACRCIDNWHASAAHIGTRAGPPNSFQPPLLSLPNARCAARPAPPLQLVQAGWTSTGVKQAELASNGGKKVGGRRHRRRSGKKVALQSLSVPPGPHPAAFTCHEPGRCPPPVPLPHLP